MKTAKTVADIVNCIENHQQFTIVILPNLQLQTLGRFSDLSNLSDALEITTSVTHLDATEDTIAFPKIVKGLCKNSSITRLDLSKTRRHQSINDLSDVLKVNKTIKELLLKTCDITLDCMRTLNEALLVNSTLKKLDLTVNWFSQEIIDELGKALQINKSVKNLAITTAAGSSSLFKHLKLNSSVAHLDLSDSNFCHQGSLDLYELMAHNKTIKILDLKSCNAATEDWSQILEFIDTNDTLTDLNVTSANLTAENYEILRRGIIKTKTLASLKIGDKIMQKNSEKMSVIVEPLAKCLRLNQSLKELKIDQVLVSSEAKQLIEGLYSNSTIQKLTLTISSLSKQVFSSFTEWYTQGARLEELSIEANVIELEAHYEFKKFLALPFKSLALGSCITSSEQKMLFEGLQNNVTLKSLSLTDCEPLSLEATLLSQIIRQSKTIRKLNLKGISPHLTKNFLNLVADQCPLTHLVIDGATKSGQFHLPYASLIAKGLLQDLRLFLAKNRTLKVLELTRIQIDTAYAKNFLEILGNNRTLAELITPGDRALMLCPELRERLQNSDNKIFQRAVVTTYILARNNNVRSAIPFEVWLLIFEYISIEFVAIASAIWSDCFTIKRRLE
jgi:hypothetical protein